MRSAEAVHQRQHHLHSRGRYEVGSKLWRMHTVHAYAHLCTGFILWHAWGDGASIHSGDGWLQAWKHQSWPPSWPALGAAEIRQSTFLDNFSVQLFTPGALTDTLVRTHAAPRMLAAIGSLLRLALVPAVNAYARCKCALVAWLIRRKMRK